MLRRGVGIVLALVMLCLLASPAMAQPADMPVKTGLFKNTKKPPLAPIAREALKLRGIPYVWGGTTLAGFDCSGFVQYVWDREGVELPRMTTQQIGIGYDVPGIRWAKAGDLLFPSYGHVMMYLGRKKAIHSPHWGDVVRVVPVYSRTYIEIRRPEGRKAIKARSVKHHRRNIRGVVYRVHME